MIKADTGKGIGGNEAFSQSLTGALEGVRLQKVSLMEDFHEIENCLSPSQTVRVE